jgi:transcriptional regulator with XRE-family HTH domain
MEKRKLVIHEILPKLLKQKNLSIREVSRRTSLPQATLNSWTKHNARPSDIQALKQVSQLLGVSLDYLLYGELVTDLDSLPTDVLLSGLFKIRLEKVREN